MSFSRQKQIITIILSGLIIVFGQQLLVKAEKLYRVDQGLTEPSFKSFRERLKSAVQRRDTTFILNSLAKDVQVSYGVCGEGIKCFQQYWFNKPNSDLWQTLSTILAQGGAFTDQSKKDFCAPYVFAKFPDKVNGEELVGIHPYGAIIGQNVNVRSRPSLKAPIVTRLTYDIVKLDWNSNTYNRDWVKILTPTPGYVSRQFIRNPFDYRACFQKLNGKWVITALIAGD